MGIRDREGFARCLQDPDTVRRIEEDMRLAARLGVTGTPAFVVLNGVFSGELRGRDGEPCPNRRLGYHRARKTIL
ncbi:DsbA family protein [Candidatus Palauibacter sp.]|uniref:DsbA family protein n=1 Tax=Candidatus Palauibacter sp. TaxID=3101350 RepID=UPI003B01F8C3